LNKVWAFFFVFVFFKKRGAGPRRRHPGKEMCPERRFGQLVCNSRGSYSVADVKGDGRCGLSEIGGRAGNTKGLAGQNRKVTGWLGMGEWVERFE